MVARNTYYISVYARTTIAARNTKNCKIKNEDARYGYKVTMTLDDHNNYDVEKVKVLFPRDRKIFQTYYLHNIEIFNIK